MEDKTDLYTQNRGEVGVRAGRARDDIPRTLGCVLETSMGRISVA
jgi:hypothetical protein